jgi:hypothetical protein
MMKYSRWPHWVVIALIICSIFASIRQNNSVFRSGYIPKYILVNPAGTCALVEYHFNGGERWYWTDFFYVLSMSNGDAFYSVVDLRNRNILRDTTTAIPPIQALSQGLVGMGNSVFYWSKDGRNAAFPGGEGPLHEWAGITQCAGYSNQSQFSNLKCNIDAPGKACASLKKIIY